MKDAKGHGSDSRGGAAHQQGVRAATRLDRAAVNRALEGQGFVSEGKGIGATQGASRYSPGPDRNLDQLHSQLTGAGWLSRNISMPEHLSDVREYGRADSKHVITVYHKHGQVRGALVDTA